MMHLAAAAALAITLGTSAHAALLEINTDNVWATDCLPGCPSYLREHFALGATFRLDTDTAQMTVVTPGTWPANYTTARLYSARAIGFAVDYDPDGDDFDVLPGRLTDAFWVGLARGPMVGAWDWRFPYDSLSWLDGAGGMAGFEADLAGAAVGTVLRYAAEWDSWDGDFPNFATSSLYGLPGPDSFVTITVLRANPGAPTPPQPSAVPLPPAGILASAGLWLLFCLRARGTGRRHAHA